MPDRQRNTNWLYKYALIKIPRGFFTHFNIRATPPYSFTWTEGILLCCEPLGFSGNSQRDWDIFLDCIRFREFPPENSCRSSYLFSNRVRIVSDTGFPLVGLWPSRIQFSELGTFITIRWLNTWRTYLDAFLCLS